MLADIRQVLLDIKFMIFNRVLGQQKVLLHICTKSMHNHTMD